MAKTIDFSTYQTANQKKEQKKTAQSNRHSQSEDWMLLSPTAFKNVSGIRISEEELRGVRQAIYEMRKKANE